MGLQLSVVSPTYNESGNVHPFVDRVFAALNGLDFELIIVDDNSPDHTWERVLQLKKTRPQLKLLRRMKPPSLSGAVIDGLTVASGEIVAVLDADLQHDPWLLPVMLQRMHNADLAVASRYMPGGSTAEWNPFRRSISRFGVRTCRLLLGLALSDPLSGYFMLRKSDFSRIKSALNDQGFKILIEIAAAMPHARIVEIPLRFHRRSAGKSRFNAQIGIAYLQQLWRLRESSATLQTAPVRFKRAA